MVDTGDGMGEIHYEPATLTVYAGASRAAKLKIARADEKGHLTVVAQVPTQVGARNARLLTAYRTAVKALSEVEDQIARHLIDGHEMVSCFRESEEIHKR